ncbi:MAG TPA: hypothetical protein VJ867_17190 [Gemmatimonadaceae bacterium]|nr:hypothetical protein [Gemmatimonadaceae bacterium]
MYNKGIAIVIGVAFTLAACSRQRAPDDQLKKDLEAASASSFEMAPAGGGQKVVSAIEQIPRPQTTERAPHGPSQAETQSHTPNAPQRDSSQQLADGPAAQKPLPASSVRPAPPGGYKSMGEVLRKAPFPIKP